MAKPDQIVPSSDEGINEWIRKGREIQRKAAALSKRFDDTGETEKANAALDIRDATQQEIDNINSQR